jgi:hypothetical protein
MTVVVRKSAEPPVNFVRPVFEKFFDLHFLDSNLLCSRAGHFGGFFKGTRLFGGHTAAQSYIASKRFRNGRQPYRIDVNFFAPGKLLYTFAFLYDFTNSLGTLDQDLIYQSTSSDSHFLSLDIHQNSVLLANATVRASLKTIENLMN